ncbi:hypothetical protein INR49_024209 [Caranx melampygus]|nr:hypothetical protein INR49_024209 [Caranx melampygus]
MMRLLFLCLLLLPAATDVDDEDLYEKKDQLTLIVIIVAVTVVALSVAAIVAVMLGLLRAYRAGPERGRLVPGGATARPPGFGNSVTGEFDTRNTLCLTHHLGCCGAIPSACNLPPLGSFLKLWFDSRRQDGH